MGSGFSKMKKQARMLEQQMQKMQEELESKEFTGTSGGGLVTVVMSGDKKLKKITINPETLSDAEGLQDLILGAFADAYQKIEKDSDGMNLSNLPFGF